MEPSPHPKKIEVHAETLLERAVRRELERLERTEGAPADQPRTVVATAAAGRAN